MDIHRGLSSQRLEGGDSLPLLVPDVCLHRHQPRNATTTVALSRASGNNACIAREQEWAVCLSAGVFSVANGHDGRSPRMASNETYSHRILLAHPLPHSRPLLAIMSEMGSLAHPWGFRSAAMAHNINAVARFDVGVNAR
jgi:hypothetical protein